ncbi:hypothetical protein [Streptomyces sp. NBC_01190]|uniref:hypothetical protein n=1 Tax=Streptomyces sp. NBC_01190 TaxID=2903767 RepID=UPI003865A611|nr:hypothetical protein OG519_29525 [Streptomyces sp. NBC_01190]
MTDEARTPEITITELTLPIASETPDDREQADRWNRERYGKRWAERIYDPRWESWLYGRHSRGQLGDWARRLRLFRYCRAVGGHANDGDTLQVAIRAETEAEVLAVFDLLGISPVVVPEDKGRPTPGVAYPAAEFLAFPNRIGQFPRLAQPGWTRIAGEDVFVYVHSARLELILSDGYEVTERQVASAQNIEPVLEVLAERIIDPPTDNPHCVCAKYYPDLWSTP